MKLCVRIALFELKFIRFLIGIRRTEHQFISSRIYRIFSWVGVGKWCAKYEWMKRDFHRSFTFDSSVFIVLYELSWELQPSDMILFAVFSMLPCSFSFTLSLPPTQRETFFNFFFIIFSSTYSSFFCFSFQSAKFLINSLLRFLFFSAVWCSFSRIRSFPLINSFTFALH